MISKKKIALILFLLLFFTYAYIYQGRMRGSSHNSRQYLLTAIVDDHSFIIDKYHKNSSDKAFYNGHFYSEKAPGVTVLALLPFYLSTRFFEILGWNIHTEIISIMRSWFATVFSVGIVTALGGPILWLLLLRFVDAGSAFVVTLVIFLGSAPFTYATMLQSHGIVISLTLYAMLLIEIRASCKGDYSFLRLKISQKKFLEVAVGICSGFIVASEFSASVVSLALVLLLAQYGWKSLIRAMLAGIAIALIVPGYQWIIYGSPFTLSYRFSVNYNLHHIHGFYGLQFPPDLYKFWLFLFSPYKGLFFWTPFFILFFFGIFDLYRRSKVFSLLTIAIVIIQILLISGWIGEGGFYLGPRYLACIIPFLAIPCAYGYNRVPHLGRILGAVSIIFTGLATSISGRIYPSVSFPLVQYYLPRILQNHIETMNLGQVFGLHGLGSLLPLAIVLIMGIVFIWKSILEGK